MTHTITPHTTRRLEMMETTSHALTQALHAVLGINTSYIKVTRNGQISCLVHENWLKQLINGTESPPTFITHDKLTDTEVSLLLHQSPASISLPWLLITVVVIPKREGKVRRSSQIKSKKCGLENLGYSQLIHYICETNYRNIWKDACNKYCSISSSHRKTKHAEIQNYNDAVREGILTIYNCPVLCRETGKRYFRENTDTHPNILPAYCAVEGSDCFYLLCHHTLCNLQDAILFSPAIFATSTTRLLFLAFQLLHAVRDLHDCGFHLGAVTVADIRMHQNYWILLVPRFWEDLWNEAKENSSKTSDSLHRRHGCAHHSSEAAKATKEKESCRKLSDDSFKENLPLQNKSSKQLDELVEQWVRGNLSNFDYLMELNRLAGRQMNNPRHHPVLPWIMDFSVPDGGWRDLTKSQYRLTKGDRQLDLVYEDVSNNPANTCSGKGHLLPTNLAVQVPHHIEVVLTDITYYIYKARRIPKSVLCQHVRHKWVPAEYPSSIQRLQEWSPDECIPEFFTDPTIFYSLHDDLPDLGVPSWCSGPEDFIQKHRMALESDHVSEKLHHWIDLIFGYKMSGAAAVKAKNVCLDVVDQHTSLRDCGMVQLFTHPHPYRMSASFYIGKTAPKTFRAVALKVDTSNIVALGSLLCLHNAGIPIFCMHQGSLPKRKNITESSSTDGTMDPKESGDEENQTDGSKTARKILLRSRIQTPLNLEGIRPECRPENQTIVLPKDYNPLAALNQIESLFSFTSNTTNRVPSAHDYQVEEYRSRSHHRKSRDMQVLGCLIAEMAAGSKQQLLPLTSSLEERYKFIVQLFITNPQKFPRCVHHALHLLLQPDHWQEREKSSAPFRYPAITSDGLPPPSAHQLLQPLIQIFPFPPFFHDLHSFLYQLNLLSESLLIASSLSEGSREDDIQKTAELKVSLVAKKLPSLLPKLSQESLELLIPYIVDMFYDRHTALLATWHLFGIISQALGPQQTVEKILDALIQLYSCDNSSLKHLKLYHRSFLLQLIIRLGLQTFLFHFSTPLVEAVGGYHDFASENAVRMDKDVLDGGTRKPVHLLSTTLDEFPQDNASADGSQTDRVLSPLDDDSSHAEGGPGDHTNVPIKVESGGGEPEVFVFENPADVEDMDSEDAVRAQESIDLGSADSNTFPEHPFDEEIWHPEEDDNDESLCASAVDETSTDRNSETASLDNMHDKPVRTYSSSAPAADTNHLSRWQSSDGLPNMEECEDEASDNVDYSSSASHLRKIASPSSPDMKPDSKSKFNSSHCNISDVASDSVIWLAHRLGPVLTAKYLSWKLLKMLSLCYIGSEQLVLLPSSPDDAGICISNKKVRGDDNASRVLECLSSIASLYGEHFIIIQYFPHVADLIISCRRQLTDTLEAGLIGSVTLLKHMIPYLTDATLMDNLQDLIIKDLLYPLVRVISSLWVTFPSGAHGRRVVTYKVLDTLYLIGLRIGFEMTRQHLSAILQRFFMSFDLTFESQPMYLQKISEPSSTDSSESKNSQDGGKSSQNTPLEQQALPCKEKALLEMKEVFTAELAYLAYVPFCKLAGGIYMENTLKNDELITKLCVLYDTQCMKETAASAVKTTDGDLGNNDELQVPSQDELIVSGEFGRNVAMIGNRIDIQSEEEENTSPAADGSTSADHAKDGTATKNIMSRLMKKPSSTNRHLKGNWRAYWEHELGQSDRPPVFEFKQIKLQTFTGHTGSVKAIHVMDNENSFISGSKDKTVKLWSLRSRGDGSVQIPCHWTYTQHRKSVLSVAFLDSLRLVGSCDSTVHVWDPFIGTCIKQLDTTKTSPVTTLIAMPPPHTSFITATTNATIRFLDARTLRYMHEFKVRPAGLAGPAGLIKCLAVSPNGNWLAVGHSSGMMSVIDLRTGLLYGTWVGHEGEILQMKAFNSTYFVSSSLDHSLSVWNAEDTKLKCYLKGPLEPVTCLAFFRGEVISGTTANRIGVHSAIDNQATYSSSRLRSDTFKGFLTTMAMLPLNKQLLLGADNGSISLLC